jgi:hypothetical protein
MFIHARNIAILTVLSLYNCAQGGYVSPSGLSPGDKFRLVFVTSGTIDALSSDINVYDRFVSDSAASAGLSRINGIDVKWSVIGSTASVYAKTRFSITDAQIFRIDGQKVSDNLTAFWSSNLYLPINIDEQGNTRNVRVYTGTSNSMLIVSNSVLGAISPPHTIIGFSGASDSFWIEESRWSQQTTKHSIYAISQELTFKTTAVPEPTSAIQAALLLLALITKSAKRRKTINDYPPGALI